MPATPHYPTAPKAHETALSELDRIGLEAARVLGRAADLLIFVRKSGESIASEDASLVRECRRDLEHARILLEGLCRRHAIELSETGAKG